MEQKRRTLQKSDIAAAIAQTDIFDFLDDIVSSDDNKEDAKAEPAFPYRFYLSPRVQLQAQR